MKDLKIRRVKVSTTAEVIEKENPDVKFWDRRSGDENWVNNFMVEGGQGAGHPSRVFVSDKLKEECVASVIDIACGPGVTYQQLRSSGWMGYYEGVDQTQAIIDKAAERGAKVIHKATAQEFLGSSKLPMNYELIHLRHILEHMPLEDGYDVLDLACQKAGQWACVVFFIPPSEEEIAQTLDQDTWNNQYSRPKLMEIIVRNGASVEITEFKNSCDHYGGNEVWWITK